MFFHAFADDLWVPLEGFGGVEGVESGVEDIGGVDEGE